MTETTTQAEPASRTIRKLSIFVFLLFVAMAITMVVMEYRAERTNAAVRAHTSAHVVATQFEWILQASAQALRRIERAVRDRGIDPNGDAQAITDINAAVENLPPDYQFSVYNSAGYLTYSSIIDSPLINVADRDYFKQLSEGAELVISPAIVSRQDGRSIFIVARRLDSNGSLAGVATIAIPAAILEDLSASLGFTGRSTISLIRTDGQLIARSPAMPTMDLSESPVFAELEKNTNGSYYTTSPEDGVDRIVGYWLIRGWPAVAIAGIDESTALREFKRILMFWAVLVLPVLLSLGYVLFRLFRVLRRDEERQQALRKAHDRNAFLLREVHHRVKNNLQTVMSLIRLQNMSKEDKDTLLGRISSMVAVHEDMYKTDRFESVEVASYLRRLIDEIEEAQGRDVEVRFEAAPVKLSGDRAMQLGLLYNELISNAFKHAWGRDEKGKLNIRLTELDEETLELVIADDGKGIADEQEKNMGSRLIEAFARQLGGEMTAENDNGTRVTVRFPHEPVLEEV